MSYRKPNRWNMFVEQNFDRIHVLGQPSALTLHELGRLYRGEAAVGGRMRRRIRIVHPDRDRRY
jgi:hypothetical protein